MSQTLPERRSQGRDERWDPFGELERFRRMLDQTFGGLAAPLRDGDAWAPAVDVEEQDDAYVVEAELPGVQRDDVDIELVGNELMISGRIEEREREGVLRRRTRRVGRFEYRLRLPEQVDPETIDARLDDGVLTVRIPKSQRSQRRRIEVGGGSS
jgi:HSP20 family protein